LLIYKMENKNEKLTIICNFKKDEENERKKVTN
jgi:hypothetical protein